MKTLKIPKEEIKLLEILKKMGEKALIKEKIKMFEKKYGCNFKEFEQKIKKLRSENIQMWDDFIEWKAYVKTLLQIEKEEREIKNVKNIKIT